MNELNFNERFYRLALLYLPHPRAATSNEEQTAAAFKIILEKLQSEFVILPKET